jgi:hypothetical protein
MEVMMQEPLLSAYLHENKFSSLPAILRAHTGWKTSYPVSLMLAAWIFVVPFCFFYIIPAAPGFPFIHDEEIAQPTDLFIGICCGFLILWLLCYGVRDGFKTRFQRLARLFTFRVVSIHKLLLYMPLLFLLLFAIVLFKIIQYHQSFPPVPVALACIFVFVAFWPFLRVAFFFVTDNAVSLWHALRHERIYETKLADPTRNPFDD